MTDDHRREIIESVLWGDGVLFSHYQDAEMRVLAKSILSALKEEEEQCKYQTEYGSCGRQLRSPECFGKNKCDDYEPKITKPEQPQKIEELDVSIYMKDSCEERDANKINELIRRVNEKM